ncbi:AAA family ATPase [Fulvivirga ulvae]|uniref:AAA family ATPase n=1 Tax=Fulvivirga ulvae TaxID=2904245 RepID=UPI001F3B8A8B|nr:AAA family ATPase [Fulvivirga ulvae]UII34001.1 AAA family ATPase [Fulvivirga ulvae]
MDNLSNKFIITGAASAGKTTLLHELGRRGFNCYEEVSRRIIRQQLSISSNALPWGDMQNFCTLTFDTMVKEHMVQTDSALCFFDRALPDIIANLDSCNLPIPPPYTQAVANAGYNKNAFILPIHPSIFVNDHERRETYAQANKIYRSIIKVYQSLGFTLHEIPLMPVSQRAEMILTKLHTYSYDIA